MNNSNSNNNNNSNKKESITNRFSKILEEEENKQIQDSKDIKEILNLNGEQYNLEQLEKRRLYLEKEINDINKALAKKSAPVVEIQPWYQDYPIINNTVTHPDFKLLTTQISIMSFLGLIMGGAHGYSLGKQQLRESIAKSAHNPLSINSIHLNSKKTIGLLVVRNAFVLSYRCGLYTAVYGGVETILRNQMGESIVNPIVGGTAVGLLAGFHLRKRGNLAIPLLMIVGSTVGGIMGMGDYVNKKYFFPKEIDSASASSSNSIN